MHSARPTFGNTQAFRSLLKCQTFNINDRNQSFFSVGKLVNELCEDIFFFGFGDPSRCSLFIVDRKRWNRSSGVGLADLTDIANEMRGNHWLPKIRNEVLLQKKRESQTELLKRAHSRLEKSFKKGLPPIISIQRLVWRPIPGTKVKGWHMVHGHFVTVTAMPDNLDRKATWFPIRYADPWGGRVVDGVIRAGDHNGYPALIADMPKSGVGKDLLKPGEQTLVVLSAVLGAF